MKMLHGCFFLVFFWQSYKCIDFVAVNAPSLAHLCGISTNSSFLCRLHESCGSPRPSGRALLVLLSRQHLSAPDKAVQEGVAILWDGGIVDSRAHGSTVTKLWKLLLEWGTHGAHALSFAGISHIGKTNNGRRNYPTSTGILRGLSMDTSLTQEGWIIGHQNTIYHMGISHATRTVLPICVLNVYYLNLTIDQD